MALNTSIIMGRICADPEVRQTPSGVSVCRFTVAVDRNYTKQGEERKADFIDCLAWRSTAEFVGKYFPKGSSIAVQGSIQTGSYEKDGIKRRTFEILVDNVSFCGSKTEDNNQAAPTDPGIEYSGDSTDFAEVTDDDLPF
jgi:single-strand DNA-binding protein